MRHCPSIGIGIGISLRSQLVGGIDSDVLAFAVESGATDLSGLNSLVKYLKGEGLYDNFVIYPMKSAQNAGSGSTVYSLGGLTDNDYSLTNSPTWATTGIDFTVAGSYGVADITGFQSQTAGCAFTRLKPQAAATADGVSYSRWFFGDTNGLRFLGSNSNTGTLTGETYVTFQSDSSDGKTGSTTASWSANEDFTEVCQFGTFGSGAAVYKDKVAFTMNLSNGSQVFTPSGSGYVADDDVYLSALVSIGSVNARLTGEYIAFALCDITLNATQRETITDFINAL